MCKVTVTRRGKTYYYVTVNETIGEVLEKSGVYLEKYYVYMNGNKITENHLKAQLPKSGIVHLVAKPKKNASRENSITN